VIYCQILFLEGAKKEKKACQEYLYNYGLETFEDYLKTLEGQGWGLFG
jgi:hypothetical protein